MKEKIIYKKFKDFISVDIDKLRPNKSYDKLILNRSYPIKKLIDEFGKIPENFLIKRNCPNCFEDNYTNELKKDYLDLVKCLNCDLIFTNPIFDEEHYKNIYKSNEYQEIVKELCENSHEYRKKRFGVERINNIKKYLKVDKPKILDVGCSTGFFVEAAIENNCKCIGIDLNPSAIDFGKKRGLELYKKDLLDVTDLNFDVITLFDVLEHLINPSEILDKIFNILKKGGLVSIYVPNYDSASRILMGKDAHFIWPTHHLNYFNIQTISDFLERRGFQIEDVNTEGLDIFDYIWKLNSESKETKILENISSEIQFFVNAGGYGKNLRVIARKK